MTRMLLAISILFFSSSATLLAAKWNPVTGDELTALFNNTVLKGRIDGKKWVGQYCSDGTGLLTMKEKDRARDWRQEGDDQICMTSKRGEKCFKFFQHAKKPARYKFEGDKSTRKFLLTDENPKICD